VAVIYYAGHGMEMGGTNYLIPIDARLATDSAIPDETVSLDRVMLAVDTAKRLRLIILDACRNNPFARGMRRSKSTRAAAVGGGLARVEVDTSDTYVAFAAKAGFTADDGDVHSPFAKALIQHLTTPGLDVRIALGRVRDAVLAETAGEQEPYVYGSLGGDIIPLVPGVETAALPAAPPVRPAGPVPKPQTIDIGTTVSRHGDWTVNCQRSSTAPKDQCALVQSVTASDRTNVGLTAIFLHSSEGKLLMRVVVPNGILLSAGLGLKIDEEDIGRVGLVRCVDAGCIAEINVEAPLLAKLERGKQATFVVFTTPTEGIGIPISLPGIAAGLERLRL
jgi:invasion protein IalB